MSLREVYENYLANPSSGALSENATLNYIPTLTTITSSAAIAKHNAAHLNVVKKKSEKIIDCVVGGNAVSLDIETTLEFVTGGGAYLPGLDDNFVSDRVVTFPMIHIVHFDSDLKIQQIRLYWDQGALLKQIDVIGARGRNWPLRDGKDQAKLIATSAARAGSTTTPLTSESTVPTANGKSRSQSNNVTRDPHASLSLFAPRDENGQDGQPKAIASRAVPSAKPPPRDYHDLFVGGEPDASAKPAKPTSTSPKKENQGMRPPPPKAQSAKPPPRDYHDLFVGNDSDNSPTTKGRPVSPEKNILSPPTVAPKGGAGKNYKPVRLFESDGGPETPQSPEKSAFKPHPKKYNHFEFGHGEDAPASESARPKTKHQSQWDFEDFTTPAKAPTKSRDQDKSQFAWEDDDPIKNSPSKAPGGKTRPDADPHFEFRDDGTPAEDRRRPAGQPRGAGNVRNNGLYSEALFEDGPEKSKPLAPVTNLQDRRKDFDAHFAMTDSPTAEYNMAEAPKPVPEARKKVVNMMGAQWDAADESPATSGANNTHQSRSSVDAGAMSGVNKENVAIGGPTGRPMSNAGIKSGGDGMGGKKGASRQWGFGDDSDVEAENFRPGKKSQAPKSEGLWDF